MEQGLSQSEISILQKQYGKNEITTTANQPPILLFLSKFPSLLNGILAFAAVFSVVVHDVIDGVFIFAVIIMNSLVEFIQEYKAEKSLEKLKEYLKPVCRVIRDRKEDQVETINIVPGDIVVLSEGDRIPADGVLLDSAELEVDESILTGESLPVVKDTNDKLFSGTLINRGHGILRVSAIGMETQFGKIAQTLSSIKTEKTPLQKKIEELGKYLSILAILIALCIFAVGLIQHRDFFSTLLISISIGVAAIPEGLPAMVTIALAIGTARMARKHAIVRKMPSVETLGSIQILLVDKTGTLTQNKMEVKKVWTPKKDVLSQLLKACILGNSATLVQRSGTQKFDVVGDRTDGALLLWAKNQMGDLALLKKGGSVIDEFVFSPEQKTITTVWKEGGKKHVYVRGAPESIIGKSSLREKEKKEAEVMIDTLAKEGYRVIGFGTKIENHSSAKRSHLEQHLTFLGCIGIYDPPRPEVQSAVEASIRAGIKTIMVTGDNELTALTIAKEVGLLTQHEDVITGEELSTMSDEQLKKIVANVTVFARTKPEDKLRITNALEELGFIVGVTGDGVNDSLALKRADVGVAMGLSGTEVAKEAADIVITDDNYATIIKAVEEGRRIYDNIIKSIVYLVSGNLAELSTVLLATIIGLPNPLLPTQILWINLVTDGLPALALAADHKDPDLLSRKPRSPQEGVLSNKRIVFVLSVGVGLAVFLVALYGLLLQSQSVLFSRTILFNALIFLHLMIAFIVRGGMIFKPYKLLILAVLITLVLQIIITTVPLFQRIFSLGF